MNKIKWKNSIQVRQLLMLLLVSVAFFAGCNEVEDDIRFTGDEYENILQYIEKNESQYSVFREIITAGKMEAALSSYNNNLGGNGYTLFLPTDDAVELYLEKSDQFNSLSELLEDTLYVKELVRYHLLNSEVLSNDFPNGAMPDKTISGDFLTIIYSEANGEINYKINNQANITQRNIELSNGIIHVIDEMLEPVVYTAYEWIQVNKNNGFSIFAEVLELSGLQDTLNYFELDDLRQKQFTEYTLFVESDALYGENNIQSADQLIELLSPDRDDFSHPTNGLYKYISYHILTRSFFLDELNTSTYNTYGDYPISVDLDIELKVNIGTEVFGYEIEGDDTTTIDYLEFDLEKSNILTKTGAIHHLNHLLMPYLPGRKTEVFQFYEEPEISVLRNIEGSSTIRKEDMELITLKGVDYLNYTNSQTAISGVNNNDYLTLYGNFEMVYPIPKILAGTYEVNLYADRSSASNASILFHIDGKKMNGIIDLKTGNANWSDFAPAFELGIVEFENYEEHEITISTLVPGRMRIDRITFEPK